MPLEQPLIVSNVFVIFWTSLVEEKECANNQNNQLDLPNFCKCNENKELDFASVLINLHQKKKELSHLITNLYQFAEFITRMKTVFFIVFASILILAIHATSVRLFLLYHFLIKPSIFLHSMRQN